MLDWIKNKTSKSRKDFGKYNFFVKSSPEIIDSSTTLTLTTYTNSSETATIPCRYRWSIIKNGLTIEVPEFKGSSFKCEPSDVGAVIQAEVISTDVEFGGTAVIQFGPVKLDVSLKKQIEIALSSGCTTMPVYLCSNGEEKECQIRLFEDLIKINHAYSETNYTFDYTIFEPRVECISKDSCRVVIVFSEKYEAELKRFNKKLFDEPLGKDLFASSVKSTHSSNNLNQQLQQSNINKLDIKFMNRNSRDIFLFVMKAFNTKKELRSSVIITKIEKIDFSNQETFDYLLEIESLKGELVKMDSVIKKSYQEKLKYMEEVRKLEKEIEEIIITYTRIVEEKFKNNVELSRDYSILSTKRDEVLTKKYQHLENENNHLNSRIQTLTKEIDTIRFKPVSSAVVQPIQSLQSQIPMLPPVQHPHEKVYFNYENYISPFTKKKSGLDDNSNVVGNILDELGVSRISSISSVRQDPELKTRLEQAEREKEQLQKKLEKSFHKIDTLEKDLFMKEQLLSSPQGQQRINYSAINFAYNKDGTNNDSLLNYTQPLNVIPDKEKESLMTENKELKRSNEILKTERQKLIEELKSSRKQEQSPLQRSAVIKQSEQMENSLNFLKTQKKDSNLTEKEKELIEALARKDSQIKLLKMENEELKKTNEKLRKTLETLKSSNQHNDKLEKKVRELEEEIDMYRKNSDALNRSQQLSMEMDNYNEEQITMLKQHNEFLTTENEKLSKACERYMTEAKETNKLRMEIIKLKEKINELQMLNSSSMVIA